LLDQPDARIDGKTYNAGCENLTLLDMADIVKKVVGAHLLIDIQPADTFVPITYHPIGRAASWNSSPAVPPRMPCEIWSRRFEKNNMPVSENENTRRLFPLS
jgi:hypothetical protein